MVADNTPPGSNTAKVVAADLAKIGIKAQDDLGHARDHVHAVLRRPEERAERLPERRVAARLPRAADDPRRDVQRQEHHLREQLELAAAERPEHQREMDKAKRILEPEARYEAWGKIDQQVVEDGGGDPVALGAVPDALLDRVIPAPELWNGGGPDVAFMAVK